MSKLQNIFDGPIIQELVDLEIPSCLDPNWLGQLSCSPGCLRCGGKTFPGCKLSPREKVRREINQIIRDGNVLYNEHFKTNIQILFFFFRVGHNHFRCYAPKVVVPMNYAKYALMNFPSMMMHMKEHISKVVDVHLTLSTLVKKIYPTLELSLAQYKFLCRWMEDEFPVLPRCVWKKMLTTSIALGFLIKRLVGHLEIFRVTIFNSIFNQRLLRNGDFKMGTDWYNNPVRQLGFLNVFFKDPSLCRR